MQIKFIFFFLILFSSCCASRKISEQRLIESDSLAQKTRLAIRTSFLPESHADLRISATDLRALPPAAVYTAKSGQATATVRFLRDTLFVSASCDSLQQLVYDYQQQIEQLSARSERKVETKERKNSRMFLLAATLAIVACLWASRSRRKMF